MVPPANALIENPIRDKVKTYPLEVLFCPNCTHNQLSVVVDPKELYSDYKYVSGTTETLKKHFQDLVAYSVGFSDVGYDGLVDYKRHFEDGNITWVKEFKVLEIGSNDGSLLNIFKELGVTVQGVDPAENLKEIQKVPTLNTFWNRHTWTKLYDNYSLILGLNVFAHNPNPYEFLQSCGRVLAPQGRVILEFPLYRNTVQRTDFGQIYHEHINYFSVNSFITLAERAFFYVSDVMEFPKIHGGTIRFVLKRGLDPHCQKVRDLINQEQIAGMAELETYKDFAKRIKDNINELYKEIDSLNRLGYKIVGYGASAKASTLLNSPWKSSDNKIRYFVDDNPLKHHQCISGTMIAVYPTDSLKNIETDRFAIVCGAHNFKEEIRNRLTKMGIKGKLINYTPCIEVEDI